MEVRYAGARQAGLTEDKIRALDHDASPLFTPRERAALRFAYLMGHDHWAIDDAVWSALEQHFNPAEIVELGVHVALCLGLGRFNAVIGIDPI
jgi:alkylhydroperoxidase family enzyme